MHFKFFLDLFLLHFLPLLLHFPDRFQSLLVDSFSFDGGHFQFILVRIDLVSLHFDHLLDVNFGFQLRLSSEVLDGLTEQAGFIGVPNCFLDVFDRNQSLWEWL